MTLALTESYILYYLDMLIYKHGRLGRDLGRQRGDVLFSFAPTIIIIWNWGTQQGQGNVPALPVHMCCTYVCCMYKEKPFLRPPQPRHIVALGLELELPPSSSTTS